MASNKQGDKHENDEYKIEVKYSSDAIKNKKVRFTSKKNKPFELTADQLIEIVAMNVNSKVLAPMFVETEVVNMTQVHRQLRLVADRDIKKGEEIRMDYYHPYPLEFALLEQVYNIASIEKDSKVVVLTKKLIDEVKEKMHPEMKDFIKKFYKSYSNLELKD